jgi:hypothetical protein
MSQGVRGLRPAERSGDLTILAAAGLLLLSLFLAWSHQFSARFFARWGGSLALRGVPRDPTAWQVLSVVDVLLALLALALVGVALRGGQRARWLAALACGIAAAFTLHALAVPPANGAVVFDPSLTPPGLSPNAPGAGPGETLALLALILALVGLGQSLIAPRRPVALG